MVGGLRKTDWPGCRGSFGNLGILVPLKLMSHFGGHHSVSLPPRVRIDANRVRDDYEEDARLSANLSNDSLRIPMVSPPCVQGSAGFMYRR